MMYVCMHGLVGPLALCVRATIIAQLAGGSYYGQYNCESVRARCVRACMRCVYLRCEFYGPRCVWIAQRPPPPDSPGRPSRRVASPVARSPPVLCSFCWVGLSSSSSSSSSSLFTAPNAELLCTGRRVRPRHVRRGQCRLEHHALRLPAQLKSRGAV